MSLHQYIVDSIRAYPTLSCRTDVLHHLFCVNGNGLHWQDGRIVSDRSKPVRSLAEMLENEESIAVRFKHSEKLGREFVARSRMQIRRENMELTFVYENADDLAYLTWYDTSILRSAQRSIYPLCQYALLAHVPDDCDPEWLAGVREMIFVIFHSKVQVRQHHRMRTTVKTFKTEGWAGWERIKTILGGDSLEIAHKLHVPATLIEQWERDEVEISQQHLTILLDLVAQTLAEREHQTNIDIADKALQDLAARFGDNGQPSSFLDFQHRQRENQQMISDLMEKLGNDLKKVSRDE